MERINWRNQEANSLKLLESWVIKTPNRRAVVFEPGVSATFMELWELSGKIYSYLKAQGIGAEDVVMYCLPRGIELYACITGTMRAGAAFVMAETGTDSERTAFIREDSGCKLYVDEEKMEEILRLEPLEGYEPINLHNLLYIAYTSGTTGHPKGVLHEYGSLDNAWRSVIFDGKPIFVNTDTYLNTSPIHFVATPICFSFTCAFGCAIAMMPYRYRNDDEAFSNYLEKADVNCGYLTPTLLRKHLPFKKPWHMCVLASEPADGLYIPGMRCYNCYASTESGCWIAGYEIKKPMTPVPVGVSRSDVIVSIVDEEGNDVPQGSVGEICFKTPYVRGYIHQNVVPPEERTFRTKDAGKRDNDGNMIVVGRIDEMFKICGYRIEPAEVADAVKATSGLEHIVVRGFVYKDISAITVFYTDDMELDPVSIYDRILRLLPEYMIPTNYIRLKEFPLLGSGKVDKLSLQPPEGRWDRFKESASEQLSLIYKGRSASIYDMACGIVLKQFAASVPYKTAWEELVQTRIAHAEGLPVPEAYDITRSDNGYGILMDKLPGTNLERLISERPDEMLSLIDRFAEAVKKLHQIDFSSISLPDAVDVSLSLCKQLDSSFCSDHEIQQIGAIFECIPRTGTFTHGDCHPGNAMWDDGNIKFFDLTFAE